MSKKLIAVASAAALALAGLVAIPTAASATVGPFNVTPTGAATNSVSRDGTTSAKSQQINVPSGDVLRFVAGGNSVAGVTEGTVVKLSIVTPGETDAITVTTTGGAKVITDTTFDGGEATSATGVSSLSDVAAAGEAVIYAYTTSTAVSTVVVSAAGSSETYYLSGLSTWAYKMNFTSSATAGVSGKFTLTGTVKDAFGNDLTTALVAADLTIAILGGSAALASGNVAASSATTYAYSTATKTYTITGNVRDSAGAQAVSLNVDADKASLKITAFGDVVTNQFFTVTATDLSGQVTALTAQVAALTADYNALVKKWNKRVASKTAPKKKAALK
jgi:hypothetical protein